jgi:hypothetical protein
MTSPPKIGSAIERGWTGCLLKYAANASRYAGNVMRKSTCALLKRELQGNLEKYFLPQREYYRRHGKLAWGDIASCGHSCCRKVVRSDEERGYWNGRRWGTLSAIRESFGPNPVGIRLTGVTSKNKKKTIIKNVFLRIKYNLTLRY